MKKIALFIFFAMTMVASVHAQSPSDDGEKHDTLVVYYSWTNVFDQNPDAFLVDPYVQMDYPWQYWLDARSQLGSEMLEEDAVVVAFDDGTWLISARWMRDYFSDDCRSWLGWMPLFFSAKIAFVMRGNFFSGSEYLYWLNFEDKKVEKLDHKLMSRLLNDYPDLQRRYESMKDYKKREVIDYFLEEYINRLNDDPGVPYLF